MVKRTRFESLSKYYDFFTKILMLGSYGYIRNRIVDNKSAKFSLDLCCGTGFVTRHINSDLIIGLDLTPGMLKINKKKNDGRKNVVLIIGDAYSLPFKDESFNSIYFTLASHEFRNIIPIIKGSFKILKNGGEITIYDIYKSNNIFHCAWLVFIKHVVEFGKCWTYTLAEWHKLLNDAGFIDVEEEIIIKASVIIRGKKK